MISLQDLINKEELNSELIKEWFNQATNKCEILPKDHLRAKNELINAQIKME